MQSLDNARTVQLANGNELVISYNEAFYDKVRSFFGLEPGETPTDEHLKEFFVRFMSAI